MIQVAPNTAIMIYLALTLSSILGVWIFSHLTRRQHKIITTENQLRICEYCQCAYVDDISKEVTQCPECKSFNKNNQYR
ncbi:MAG: hypothetical protein VX777_02525 [Chlamydiota bacterium]|nr:hypothetical protein [Chlamydiota bacterium]